MLKARAQRLFYLLYPWPTSIEVDVGGSGIHLTSQVVAKVGWVCEGCESVCQKRASG